MIVTSTLLILTLPSILLTSASSFMESAPLYLSSVSGKCLPISSSPAAPSSASISACTATSASEWPSSPRLLGIGVPQSIRGLPGTSLCTSYPLPVLVVMRISSFVVILLLDEAPSTSTTFMPAYSATEASSVVLYPSLSALLCASRMSESRKDCGVCALYMRSLLTTLVSIIGYVIVSFNENPLIYSILSGFAMRTESDAGTAVHTALKE